MLNGFHLIMFILMEKVQRHKYSAFLQSSKVLIVAVSEIQWQRRLNSSNFASYVKFSV